MSNQEARASRGLEQGPIGPFDPSKRMLEGDLQRPDGATLPRSGGPRREGRSAHPGQAGPQAHPIPQAGQLSHQSSRSISGGSGGVTTGRTTG